MSIFTAINNVDMFQQMSNSLDKHRRNNSIGSISGRKCTRIEENDGILNLVSPQGKKLSIKEMANIYKKIMHAPLAARELDDATRAFKKITNHFKQRLNRNHIKSPKKEMQVKSLEDAGKNVQSVEKHLKGIKSVKNFCTPETKKLLLEFQKSENDYMLRQKKLDSSQENAKWITVAATEKHIGESFDYLEKRVEQPISKQIPIVLGGLELRKATVVDDVVGDAGTITKGIVANFGSLHQQNKLDAKQDDATMLSRAEHQGYGGVLESNEWSLSFNLIGTLTPSVFTGEPLVYGRESDNAVGLLPYERSISSEGKISLTAIRETDPNLDEQFKNLPNVKAKELMFLLKAGFKPHWDKVGNEGKHMQLSFIPPKPEEFTKNFPLALQSLAKFRETKIDGHGEFEQLLRKNGLLE